MTAELTRRIRLGENSGPNIAPAAAFYTSFYVPLREKKNTLLMPLLFSVWQKPGQPEKIKIKKHQSWLKPGGLLFFLFVLFVCFPVLALVRSGHRYVSMNAAGGRWDPVLQGRMTSCLHADDPQHYTSQWRHLQFPPKKGLRTQAHGAEIGSLRQSGSRDILAGPCTNGMPGKKGVVTRAP